MLKCRKRGKGLSKHWKQTKWQLRQAGSSQQRKSVRQAIAVSITQLQAVQDITRTTATLYFPRHHRAKTMLPSEQPRLDHAQQKIRHGDGATLHSKV